MTRMWLVTLSAWLLPGLLPYILAQGDIPMENLQECINSTDFDPNTDYFPHKVTVEEAVHFSVEYFNHYKIVRNLEDNQTYVLVQCGAPAPDPPIAEAAYTVDVPLTQVALQYSTMEAFFETLGARRVVQAILGTSFSTASCMQDLVDDGNIIEMDDGQASSNATYVNEQGSLEISPNLTQSFSADTLVGFIGRTPWNPKTYPFPTVRSSEALEPSREGLFETVKFYSTFLNKEGRANELWDQVQGRLDCVQANAAQVNLEQGQQTTILWASYSTFCNAWDVARCGPFYYNDFAEICSANLLCAEMGGTYDSPDCASSGRKFMTTQEFVAFGKDADVWIYPQVAVVPINDATIFTDEVKAFKSFVGGELYDTNGGVGWFDQAYIQPDVLIEDFCDLSGTLDLENGLEYQRKWFRNVFTNDVNTPNPTCDELGGVDTPRETGGSDCALRTAFPTETPTIDGFTIDPTEAPSAAGHEGGLVLTVTLTMMLVGTSLWW